MRPGTRLWRHPLGRELRLMVNNELLRSQVFKGADLGWAALAVRWRDALYAKGWSEPPRSEPLG